MSYQQMDGPGVSGAISVTNSATEAKVGATRLSERQSVTVQPLNGDIYWGYSALVTSSNGTKIFKGQFFPFEASDSLPIYLVSGGGTVDTRITEAG